MKQVSVVILNWNGRKLLEQFLPSVVRHTPNDIADIIIADNGSTDDSVKWTQQQYPQVKVIRMKENLGYAGGYNKALEQIDTSFSVLLNSDVEVTEGWLLPLIAFCQDNPETGVCQPKIKSYRNRSFFEYAGASGGFIDKYGYPYCRGRIFSTIEQDNGQYNNPINIFWASGACLFIRTKLFHEMGGFDSLFFAHMEEIDLCWRILLTGKKICVVPQSEVFHLGAATLTETNPQKTFLNFRNNLLMLYKNLPIKDGRPLLFKRRLFDTAAFFKFLLTGKAQNAFAIIRAHNDFRKQKFRYNQQPTINILHNFKEASRNITIDYFIRKQRFFNS